MQILICVTNQEGKKMSMFRYHTAVTEQELIERFNTSYPGQEKDQWSLPCGVTFFVPGYGDTRKFSDNWLFRYNYKDKPLTLEFADNWGMLERGELIHLLGLLEAKEKRKPGFDLFKKPSCIRQLEFLTGYTAKLNHMGCLQWALYLDDGKHTLTCVNNPYDTLRINASSKYDFEVFTDDSEDSFEYVSYKGLVDMLVERNFTINSVICSFCKRLSHKTPLSRCTRCKLVYYCDAECQKKHWVKEHKFVCK